MRQRRITIVTSELLGRPGTGGAGTADSLLAVALGRHGHRVELLVASGRDSGDLSPEWTGIYRSAEIEIQLLDRIPGVRPPYLAPTLGVFHALRDRQPDLVIANDWRGLGWAAMRARQTGLALTETAFVVHCHGPARVLAEFAQKVPDTVPRFAEEITERTSIELADAVVSPSAWLLGWMRAHNWPVPESEAVIPYVGESAALDKVPSPAPSEQAVRRIAFFGQIREGKGIRIFLSALGTLEPALLDGVEVVFLGRESARWTTDRITGALSKSVRSGVAGVSFETGLDRDAALNELRRPGTLAVMPSLLDNSPNTVSECIEHGIPFVATRTGGIPELVAGEDHERVLCLPTTMDLAAALRRALTSRPGFAPARPAREPRQSLDRWLDLVEKVEPRPRPTAPRPGSVAIVARGGESANRAEILARETHSVAVEVVQAASRRDGLARTGADWVVFLDEEDVPEAGLIDALVTAQVASGTDAVTVAVRPSDDPSGIQLFLGNPGALGLVQNQYGVLGLVRRHLAATEPMPEDALDPDWLLFARLALRRAAVVSIPEPFAGHAGRPGHIADVPGEGLAVLEAFEDGHAAALQDLSQLAAALAVSIVRLEAAAENSAAPDRGVLPRGLAVLRAEGIRGVTRRVRARLD